MRNSTVNGSSQLFQSVSASSLQEEIQALSQSRGLGPQTNPLSDLGDRSLRDRAGFARAFTQNCLDTFRVRLQLLLALADRLEMGNHAIGQRPFAIAAVVHPERTH